MASFRSALDECLAALQQGESVDACLARYPAQADRLRPMLTLASRIAAAPPVRPRPEAQARAWNKVHNRTTELRGQRFRLNIGFSLGPWVKPLAYVSALVLVFFALGGATAYAAQDAMPDSPLYPVKLAGEDVRLWFVFDDTHEANILLDQSDQRMEEITEMVLDGKSVPDNVLSDLHGRHERAVNILESHPEETSLRARVIAQSQEHEERLVALWPEISEGARDNYTEAVALFHNTRLQTSGSLVSIRPEDLSDGVLTYPNAIAVAAADGTWTVGGVEVLIDERTIGQRELQAGVPARFVVARSSNGRLRALSVFAIRADLPPTGSVVSGAVEQVTSLGVTVAGQFIPFSDKAPPLKIKPGDRISITIGTSDEGIVAENLQPQTTPSPAGTGASDATATVAFEGTLGDDVATSVNRWTIGGIVFTIGDTAIVDTRGGDARPGARAQVEAVSNGGQMFAERVTILASQAPAETATVIGTFQGYGDDVWLISGVEVIPPVGGSDPAEGATVSIDARREGLDLVAVGVSVVETRRRQALFRWQGTILNIDGSRWTLEWGEVRVAAGTATVTPNVNAVIGMRAIIWGERGPDGALQARFVRLLDQTSILPVPVETAAITP